MNPILIDIPVPIETKRLLLRPPMPGDGAALNKITLESFDDIHPWLPWANTKPSVQESEEFVRRSYAAWIMREQLQLLIVDKTSKRIVGGTGVPRLKWDIRSFEIGYWLSSAETGKGFMQEAVAGLTHFLFDQLKAQRVEIRCETLNERSANVARKLGFTLEGILRKEVRSVNSDELRDMMVFSRLNAEGLPISF